MAKKVLGYVSSTFSCALSKLLGPAMQIKILKYELNVQSEPRQPFELKGHRQEAGTVETRAGRLIVNTGRQLFCAHSSSW